ncbi:hypothetical protein BGW80DRAFT_1258350 [Lactifluus volemus]|nr:hypothetical protein BGW80DRAFT_1258350 [Lactifluus volemus]
MDSAPPSQPPHDILRCAVDKKMWRPTYPKPTFIWFSLRCWMTSAKLEAAKAAACAVVLLLPPHPLCHLLFGSSEADSTVTPLPVKDRTDDASPLLHSLPHGTIPRTWNSLAGFETAARGYVIAWTPSPNGGLQATLGKVEISTMMKTAGAQSGLKCGKLRIPLIQQPGAAPQQGTVTTPLCIPTTPPLWGAKEENQRTFYYHYLLLRRELNAYSGWTPWPYTAEWRSILGHTYWKSMWPKPDPMTPRVHQVTTPPSSGSTAGPYHPLPSQLEHAWKRSGKWIASSFHSIKQSDGIMGGDVSVDGMTDMWGPIRNGGVKSGFFEDKTAWRTWLRCLREVVMEWDGFDAWDWGSFTDSGPWVSTTFTEGLLQARSASPHFFHPHIYYASRLLPFLPITSPILLGPVARGTERICDRTFWTF